MSDPANEPKWQDGVVDAHVSSGGALGIGVEISETRRFMGRDMVSKLTVTEYEENKKFGGKGTEGPVPFEVTQTFEPAVGGTKVGIVIQGEPEGFIKLAGGIVQKQLQNQIAGGFERVKKILEG
jgi:hypothetical protein